jgi:hypothetical protein
VAFYFDWPCSTSTVHPSISTKGNSTQGIWNHTPTITSLQLCKKLMQNRKLHTRKLHAILFTLGPDDALPCVSPLLDVSQQSVAATSKPHDAAQQSVASCVATSKPHRQTPPKSPSPPARWRPSRTVASLHSDLAALHRTWRSSFTHRCGLKLTSLQLLLNKYSILSLLGVLIFFLYFSSVHRF